MKSIALTTLLLATVCLTATPEAKADNHGAYGPTGFYGYGLYGYRSLYGLGRLPVPPYYALHPPVYYSKPVARTYGTSPFACPCGEYAVSEPKGSVIENPHYEPAKPQKAATNQTARVIHNPFFEDGTSLVTVDE